MDTITTTFNHATLKVYFTAGHTCRNIYDVTQMDKTDNMMSVKTHGETIILNFDNINTIEVLEEGR